MDLADMTYLELNKLFIQVNIEMLKRSWWVIPLIIAIAIILQIIIFNNALKKGK